MNANYEAAATEALRFLFVTQQPSYTFYAHYLVGISELRLGRVYTAIDHMYESANGAPSADLERAVRIKLALALIEGRFNQRAKIELLRLMQQKADSHIVTQSGMLLGILYAFENRFEESAAIFTRSRSFAPSNVEFNKAVDSLGLALEAISTYQPRRNSDLAKWLSTFLPGSGQIYAGRVVDGTIATLLNVSTTLWVRHTLLAGQYINAAVLAPTVWWRYYQGNRLHAEEYVIQSNQHEQRSLTQALDGAIQRATSFLGRVNPEIDLKMVEIYLASEEGGQRE